MKCDICVCLLFVDIYVTNSLFVSLFFAIGLNLSE